MIMSEEVEIAMLPCSLKKKSQVELLGLKTFQIHLLLYLGAQQSLFTGPKCQPIEANNHSIAENL